MFQGFFSYEKSSILLPIYLSVCCSGCLTPSSLPVLAMLTSRRTDRQMTAERGPLTDKKAPLTDDR